MIKIANELHLIFWLLILPVQIFALVRLPHIFSDNLVIQQQQPFKLSGWETPGKLVRIRFNWLKEDYTVTANDKGRWSVTCAPPAAGGPYRITISGENQIVLSNLLCGEVWLCAGQSNMEMGLKIVDNGAREVQQANYPQIRLFDVQKASGDSISDDVSGNWKVCSPQSVSEGNWEGFSAVAYFFGRRIHHDLGVPVGLIDVSWSATSIEPWIAPEGYESVPEITGLYKQRFDLPTTGPWGEPYRPVRIYNTMLAPLTDFSLRGVLWYQGESNVTDGAKYYFKLKALVEGWRNVWRLGDFPFYFVQIAPFKDYAENDLKQFWSAQRRTLEIANTGMASTEDIGDWNDIHPTNKLAVGERLAELALTKTYNRK